MRDQIYVVACKYGDIEAHSAYFDEDDANEICDSLNAESPNADEDEMWEVVETTLYG